MKLKAFKVVKVAGGVLGGVKAHKEYLAMTRMMKMMRNGGNHFVAVQIKKKKEKRN